tara:strand:+ start:6306 stop:8117 length:1812 start_codon:yes stop_codon:yes gene_type:complete
MSNKKDKIPGGLADNKSPKDFDPKKLAQGVKVEMEHTSDKSIATEIAMDHLTEDSKYYQKLAVMEKSVDDIIDEVLEKGGAGSGKRGHRSIVTTKEQREGNQKRAGEKRDTGREARRIISQMGLDKEDLKQIRDYASAEGITPSQFIVNNKDHLANNLKKGGKGSGKKGHTTIWERNASEKKARMNASQQERARKTRGEGMRRLKQLQREVILNDSEKSELKLLQRMYPMKKSNQENNMSIETEIEQVAKSMEDSNTDPNELVIQTIKDLGPEGLKKAMENLNEDQKVLLKGVLEDMNKGRVEFDDVYDGDKHFAKLEDMGTEVENGSDDEDEKLVKPAAASIEHQGDSSPEGRDGHIIKSDVDSIINETLEKGFPGSEDEKEDKKIAQKEAKKEVKGHEKKMHKSKEELIEMKNTLIKSYTDAGLEYTDDLIKAQMKKMLKEEDQVKPADQELQGPEDKKSDRKPCKDMEEGKLAEETADEALAKVPAIKKSFAFEKDEMSLLKANTGGRNFHYSINAHYDDALAKAQKGEEVVEELVKSEKEPTICDIIEKGQDQDADSVLTEQLIKSHKTNGHTSETFSNTDMFEAMGMTEEEAKEILGE